MITGNLLRLWGEIVLLNLDRGWSCVNGLKRIPRRDLGRLKLNLLLHDTVDLINILGLLSERVASNLSHDEVVHSRR